MRLTGPTLAPVRCNRSDRIVTAKPTERDTRRCSSLLCLRQSRQGSDAEPRSPANKGRAAIGDHVPALNRFLEDPV